MIDDKKTALKLNEKLLSKYGENPLVNLALAKVDDNKTLVEAISNKLIENKETLVLGLKGLIELNEGVDDTKALVYANQAFKETKLPWALKSAVRLMIKNGLYEDALKSLDGNKKLISQEEFKEVKVSLLMKLSENEAKKEKYLNEVIKLDYTFVPAYISLASFYKDKGKDNKALKCLKKAYQTNPDIMIYDYVEKNLCGDGDIIKITKELIEDNLNNDVSTLILARSHMKAGIFGQALNYFKEYLVNNAPNTKIALFMAKLEKEMGNLKEVEKWNNAILNAEFDGKYRCEKCGFEYSSWQASCDNCGSFSSIKWSDLNSKSKEIVAYN
ncbi:MAG: tetratricopeptide repeat protein [Alphaproteobacteria bacterium ADurb.Bin438]|nr:MAG: tetratricopeptide repeat protein [Alphaproteobacteria bacterium ADurb.Bin438]